MTLVEFLRAQLDEDERLAKAAVISAHGGPNAYQPHPELSAWRYVPGDEVEYVSTPEMLAHEHHEPYRVTCDSEGLLPAVDEEIGPHIARHDPARVLAQVDANRAILDLHTEHLGRDCRLCGGDYPCETVRHLGAVYDGRDGYDESWRP